VYTVAAWGCSLNPTVLKASRVLFVLLCGSVAAAAMQSKGFVCHSLSSTQSTRQLFAINSAMHAASAVFVPVDLHAKACA
jgi:hypothetical protein